MTMSLTARALSLLHRKLNPLIHLGGALFCPVCRHPVRWFDPLPGELLEKWGRYGFDLDVLRFETLNIHSYSCPLCTVSDRDRLYALCVEQLRSSDLLPDNGKFVEFAPIGPLTSRLKSLLPAWEYRTADLMMHGVNDRVDICNMQKVYEDASIDTVLCSHVLEHVPDDSQALSELKRILKPGGLAILMVPVHLDLAVTREGGLAMSEAERWARFGQGDHIRLHSKSGWEKQLHTAGFEMLDPHQFLPSTRLLPRYGIDENAVVYLARKAAE